MRQEMLWTKVEGHERQMTATLVRDQNGSADTRLCHWLFELCMNTRHRAVRCSVQWAMS